MDSLDITYAQFFQLNVAYAQFFQLDIAYAQLFQLDIAYAQLFQLDIAYAQFFHPISYTQSACTSSHLAREWSIQSKAVCVLEEARTCATANCKNGAEGISDDQLCCWSISSKGRLISSLHRFITSLQ